MKVLQINKLYYPWVGGVETVVQNIAEGLQERVHMEVLVCRPKGFSRNRRVNGVKVHEVSSLGIYKGIPVSVTYPFHFSKLANRFDVIHFHLPFPIGVLSTFVTSLRKTKTAVTYHSDIVRQKGWLKLYRSFLNRFLNQVDLIMPTSPDLMESSSFLQPYRNKCKVVPLSLDVDEFSARHAQPIDLSIPDGKPVVLYVGRLAYYKGVRYLLRAFKKVDATLLIVGEGPLKKKLKRFSKELGVDQQVKFLGYLSDEQLKFCYERADLFVLPSTEASEAFGLVQLEAMASKLPVVNTDLPTGVPFVSRHGETGLTVPPADADELAGAINRLLSDDKLYNRLSGNTLARVKDKFTREKMMDSIFSVYQGLID